MKGGAGEQICKAHLKKDYLKVEQLNSGDSELVPCYYKYESRHWSLLIGRFQQVKSGCGREQCGLAGRAAELLITAFPLPGA